MSPTPIIKLHACCYDVGTQTRGFVNLVKTTPEAGGNALVPRSHLFPPAEFGRDPATHKDGKPTRPAVIEHICNAAKANPGVIGSVIISHLEPGDLLLWKDAVLHSGVPCWDGSRAVGGAERDAGDGEGEAADLHELHQGGSGDGGKRINRKIYYKNKKYTRRKNMLRKNKSIRKNKSKGKSSLRRRRRNRLANSKKTKKHYRIKKAKYTKRA